MPQSPVLSRLPARDRESADVHVVIDTPKGSRNKYAYDDALRLFTLSGVLPAGAVFPYDFGFVPSTRGGDGDPLDVLVLMDDPAFTGCLVPVRLVGVLEAEQEETGAQPASRNDRLIAIASSSRNHRDVRTLADLSAHLLDEIEHFFISYNAAKQKRFTVLARSGPKRAEAILRAGERVAASKSKVKRKSTVKAKANRKSKSTSEAKRASKS